jgi:transposase
LYEYKEKYPDGYQFTQFRYYYNKEKKKLNISLRQNYRAGDKLFTDYAGDTIPVINSLTGEVRKAYIFTTVLAATNYTFCEASFERDNIGYLSSNINALEFYGGVPALIIPDNLKTAVTKSDRFESNLNRTFEEFANYYGLAILPARVRKPKDKAKVEKGVQIVEQWIIASLRKRTFFSLEELNNAIDRIPLKEKEQEKEKDKSSETEQSKPTSNELNLYSNFSSSSSSSSSSFSNIELKSSLSKHNDYIRGKSYFFSQSNKEQEKEEAKEAKEAKEAEKAEKERLRGGDLENVGK